MMPDLIFGTAALIAVLFTGFLALAIVGIKRGDRGKRLYGRSADCTEAFARRVLTGSRGCTDYSDEEDGR